jgi:hypothetical protein
MKGGPVIAWDPAAGTHIGIMPRNGTTANIRWFKGPAAYVYHPLNAYTEGDKVVLWWASGNRDGSAFANPDDVDIAVQRLNPQINDLAYASVRCDSDVSALPNAANQQQGNDQRPDVKESSFEHGRSSLSEPRRYA